MGGKSSKREELSAQIGKENVKNRNGTTGSNAGRQRLEESRRSRKKKRRGPSLRAEVRKGG